MLALSKADLVPDLDVFRFRDLVISKAHEDIDELRHVLEGLVESPDALSVGEDFVLLSSAKFNGNQINVDERIGLDLILPLAAMLPFERHKARYSPPVEVPVASSASMAVPARTPSAPTCIPRGAALTRPGAQPVLALSFSR